VSALTGLFQRTYDYPTLLSNFVRPPCLPCFRGELPHRKSAAKWPRLWARRLNLPRP